MDLSPKDFKTLFSTVKTELLGVGIIVFWVGQSYAAKLTGDRFKAAGFLVCFVWIFLCLGLYWFARLKNLPENPKEQNSGNAIRNAASPRGKGTRQGRSEKPPSRRASVIRGPAQPEPVLLPAAALPE